jgi:pantoate--beta-alanine ligase
VKIIKTFPDLWKTINGLPRPMGFVPTMGYLHEGHISLVREAKMRDKSVVVSIFTNPTQFSPDEDLENYPTDIERDLSLLKQESVDLVWLPSREDMYGRDFQTWVDVEQLTQKLEGKYRPTHFRGVTTIVSKLFNAIQPDRAYFGQKDAQQSIVIKRMIKDLNYPIEIVVCPTIREVDGLAMSSRNGYLSPPERQASLCLSRALRSAKKAFEDGERNAEKIKALMKAEIDQESLAGIQYISCSNLDTLEELDGEIEECLLSLAVYIGTTRLIDNIKLPEDH